jgi:hypothetical protein
MYIFSTFYKKIEKSSLKIYYCNIYNNYYKIIMKKSLEDRISELEKTVEEMKKMIERLSGDDLITFDDNNTNQTVIESPMTTTVPAITTPSFTYSEFIAEPSTSLYPTAPSNTPVLSPMPQPKVGPAQYQLYLAVKDEIINQNNSGTIERLINVARQNILVALYDNGMLVLRPFATYADKEKYIDKICSMVLTPDIINNVLNNECKIAEQHVQPSASLPPLPQPVYRDLSQSYVGALQPVPPNSPTYPHIESSSIFNSVMSKSTIDKKKQEEEDALYAKRIQEEDEQMRKDEEYAKKLSQEKD